MSYVLFRAFAFLNHLLKAKNRYGLHSPFLYQLYESCFLNDKRGEIDEIEAIRKALLKNTATVSVNDFKRNQQYEIKVSKLANSASSPAKFSKLLLKMADYLQARTILETGTLFGLNTLYLAHSGAEKIITIEGNQSLAAHARQHFQALEKAHIEIVEGDLFDTFETAICQCKPDFIFLDAHHNARAMEFYHQVIQKHCVPKAIIYHDIHWSPEMLQSWQKIHRDPAFHLTAETFDAGFIFPQIKAEKQHFMLKF
jgi:predicted O-methyltransferase YrrM